MAPNSPIGIKKFKRCPQIRAIIRCAKKYIDCVVRLVPEHFTSQTCANCHRRFPRNTKAHRFKVCRGCRAIHKGDPNVQPNTDKNVNLPKKIVTQHSKRDLQLYRDVARTEALEMNQPVNCPLVPKVKICRKNWPPIDMAQDDPKLPTVVWHRDIVAAKCILYKGMYDC